MMKIHPFFDKFTSTFTYIVIDENTKQCAIIDSVQNYNPDAGRLNTQSADELLTYIAQEHLTVQWILETHIHADHITAASYLKEKTGAKIGIGKQIIQVLKFWVPIFNTFDDTPLDGSQFDKLFSDGEIFNIGSLQMRVMYTPGHTPACVTYLVEDSAFVGDTIFMPYVGTSRSDFPGGNARDLYLSIQKILSLPDETRLYACHDYPPEGKMPTGECTVKDQKMSNILINERISEEEFIDKRTKRDATLSVPRLILPSIQMNMRTGLLGKPEANKTYYIKIPINTI